jgi:RsiW-degrading membrane proteinase PrsW (M82 family)
MEHVAKILFSLLPVIGFLFALKLMDGYKLMRIDSVMFQVLAGTIVAFVALVINRWFLGVLGWEMDSYARYGSPVVEEVLKGAYLVYLVRAKRIGFMIDAAICGFALGTGFAIVENALHLRVDPGLSMFSCVLRGFGTAVMHGGATTLFGILTQNMAERYVIVSPRVFAPGLLVAIAFHSLFNHLRSSPVLTVLVLIIVLPSVIALVFRQSELVLRRWMGSGLDVDTDLLEMINSGKISGSRIGKYIRSLSDRFPSAVVADMLCLLRLHSELSIKAKGMLLMREAEKLAELEFLERSVGTTGMLALAPFLRWRTRDLWQLHMLGRRPRFMLRRRGPRGPCRPGRRP